jgi:hypothetical protein
MRRQLLEGSMGASWNWKSKPGALKLPGCPRLRHLVESCAALGLFSIYFILSFETRTRLCCVGLPLATDGDWFVRLGLDDAFLSPSDAIGRIDFGPMTRQNYLEIPTKLARPSTRAGVTDLVECLDFIWIKEQAFRNSEIFLGNI